MDPTPRTLAELVGPELLASLDRLDVLSRKIFSGKLPGERRSKRRGQGVEFDDFRPYVAGDDLRHIDWNVYARLERLFLKLFREEEDLALHLLVDASPSMDVGRPSKLLFAHRLAMALGYIGLVNHNRVRVATFGLPAHGGSLHRLAPMRGRRNIERLGRFLLESVAGDGSAEVRERPQAATDFNEVCRRIGLDRAERGVLVVISDFFFREGWLPGLNYLAGGPRGGFDAWCVQVLSPEEIDPGAEGSDLVGDLRLLDAESGHAAEVTVSAALLKRYRQRLEGLIAGLERDCRARGMRHLLVPSDTDVGALVLGELRGRGMLG